jgi:integrase
MAKSPGQSLAPPTIYPLDRSLEKRWFVRFWIWHEGKQKHVVKKVFGYINTFHTMGERLAAAQELKAEIQKLLKEGWTVGKKKASEKKKLFQGFTIEQALDFVVEKKENETREGSPKIYRAIKKFFPPWLEQNGYAGLLIKDLNGEILQAYLDHLKEKGTADKPLSNKTINNYKTAFVAVCNSLQKREKIWKEHLPTHNLGKLLTSSDKHAAYNPFQLKQIKESCKELGHEYLWLFAQFIYYTLARPHELRHLRVEHLEPEQDRIYVPSIAKGRAGDYIDMYAPLKQLILDVGIKKFPGHYFVFTRFREPGAEQIGKNYFYKLNRKVLEATGLDKNSRNFDLYSYKHTGCIALHNAGVPLIDIMRQCRHKTPEQTMKYLRELDLFRKKDHLQKVEAI